ncbi:MAG TPA: hypothetical protein VL943_09300, partial [Niabella sp.]|nr:hypothetical protein [Niabella sp.]
GKDAIFSLALENGARSILSDSATPNNANILLDPFFIHVDTTIAYGLVTDKQRKALVAVDLINGQRVILSKSATSSPN